MLILVKNLNWGQKIFLTENVTKYQHQLKSVMIKAATIKLKKFTRNKPHSF